MGRRYVDDGGEMLVAFAIATVCLTAPVSGPMVAGYSPIGQYGGHWGVDFSAEVGDTVRAPVSGLVTFAGSVAGTKSVTIQPVPGFKVSVSYLSEIRVSAGGRVDRGRVLGAAGIEGGVPGVHLSTRINGRYTDPKRQLGCETTDITRALRLVTPPQPYPRSRAYRNPGRDVRSDPYRPSTRRGDGSSSGRARSGPLHSGRRPVAKAGPTGQRHRTSVGDGPSCHGERRWISGRR